MADIEEALMEYGRHMAVERNDTSESKCLADEEIAEFVDGTSREKQQERVVKHLAQCSYCTKMVGDVAQAIESFDTETIEVPELSAEARQRIVDEIVKSRMSLFKKIVEDFKREAKILCQKYISMYHTAEEEAFEVFWDLLSSMIEKGVKLERTNVEVGALAIAGRSGGGENRISPPLILTIGSIFNEIADLEELKEETVRDLIRENALLFELPSEDAERLESYILTEILHTS